MHVKSIFYFIFISVFTYWGEVSIVTEVTAASVIPEAATSSNKPLKINISSNKKRLPNQITKIDIESFPVSFMQISDFISPPSYINKSKNRALGETQKNNTRPVLYTNLYEQGKQFIAANKNNEVLQDSLIVFSKTKQFLREKDLMLHDLTQELFLSLNLAYPDQNKLLFQQQKNMVDIPAKNSFRQQSEIIRLQNLSKPSNAENFTSDNRLFTLIFTLKNLYYLFAVLVLFYIVKQIIKLMFMKDLHDRKNGR